MLRNFKWPPIPFQSTERSPRFWLQLGVGALALLNIVMLVLNLFPLGGSRSELNAERQGLRTAVLTARVQSARLKSVASKVQLGGDQAAEFESRYILSQRLAYESVIEEIQRMATAASLVQREGTFNEEPIDGTADLSLLNITVNFEGPYTSLTRFLLEVDRSPMLLMLDSLQASPEKEGRVVAAARFQAVVRDDAVASAGGQQ
jgi:Tfp pilus assembly protein PilO